MRLKRNVVVINFIHIGDFQVFTDTRIDTVSHLNGYSTHLKASDYFLALEIACKIACKSANLNRTIEYTNIH